MASVEVVIPVYNEQYSLAQNVAKLRQFLEQHLPHKWTIVITDNGSTDRTAEIGRHLSQEYPNIRFVHLDVKGRGWALYHTWRESQADIVSYMDADMSTRLEAFPKLIQAIEEGYDMAIGSRLLPNSQVQRSRRREILSRCYNIMVKVLFGINLSDSQCGFKALRARSAQLLLPLIKDRQWFFDTELLILAHRKRCSIKEIPVFWVEDSDSRVTIVKTAFRLIMGLIRMRFQNVA